MGGEATHAADGLQGPPSSDVWYYQPCFWEVPSASVSRWMSSQEPNDYFSWPSSDLTSAQASFCEANASSQTVPSASTGWVHSGDVANFAGQEEKFVGFPGLSQLPQNAGEYSGSEMSTKVLEARP